jgi:hypothetical protein
VKRSGVAAGGGRQYAPAAPIGRLRATPQTLNFTARCQPATLCHRLADRFY